MGALRALYSLAAVSCGVWLCACTSVLGIKQLSAEQPRDAGSATLVEPSTRAAGAAEVPAADGGDAGVSPGADAGCARAGRAQRGFSPDAERPSVRLALSS